MALGIAEEMAALDKKDREFLDNLTPDEKKKFSTFLMIRWGSSVGGSSAMQGYYLLATNDMLNKNFFNIPKQHDKLNWLAATAISPGKGVQRHQWIGLKKKEGSTAKVSKFVRNLYPAMKQSDIDLMIKMNDDKTWKEMAKDLGMTPEQIKKEL